jgi:hypothetical protein
MTRHEGRVGDSNTSGDGASARNAGGGTGGTHDNTSDGEQR